MSWPLKNFLGRLFATPYHPAPDDRAFLQGAVTQAAGGVEVTVAIADARQSQLLFGVPVARHGLQPVFLRVKNGSARTLRLQFRSIDPKYSSPLEAAARCHFSLIKRISAFGIGGLLMGPLLLLLMPLKLLTAQWANRRMDVIFQTLGFHRRPIAPGETVEGFVYATRDDGTKIVRVYLMAIGGALPGRETVVSPSPSDPSAASNLPDFQGDVDLTFSLPVPDIQVDYEHRQLAERVETEAFEDCDVPTLKERFKSVAIVTTDRKSRGTGDPLNLVVVGSFKTILLAFVGRWDETEAITLATCWKTVRAFLLGSEYRYSPVSPLYVFGRSQDIALQQIRESINVRIHLRLWLAPYRLRGKPVWVGQVSRDIGVRFTTKVWNLTTHRIDPDVDESRDFVLDDILDAERVDAAAFVTANAPSTATSPRHNLTGDPYYTDGRRVVILLAEHRTRPRFMDWS